MTGAYARDGESYSSCSFSFAITLKSSSVVVSPLIFPFVASSFNGHRLTFGPPAAAYKLTKSV